MRNYGLHSQTAKSSGIIINYHKQRIFSLDLIINRLLYNLLYNCINIISMNDLEIVIPSHS